MTKPVSNLLKLSAPLVVLMALTGTAAAADPVNEGAKFFIQFQEYDVNRNGLVSRDEFKGSDGEFRKLDGNNDDFLVQWEMAIDDNWKKFRMGRSAVPVEGNGAASIAYSIGHCDRNQDGKLSADEYPGPPERFTAVDKNGDGFMTAEEIRRSGPPFRAWDLNVDGIITKAEFKGSADQFAMIDGDKNGSLNIMEMRMGSRKAGLAGPRRDRRFRGPVLQRHGGC